VFNHFNSGTNDTYMRHPNKTDNTIKNGVTTKQYGWGMCQLDKGPPTNANYIVSTREVYNWLANIDGMLATLNKKRQDHVRFMGYFTNTYAAATNPPSITLNNVTMSAEMFGTIVLYNGVHTNVMPRSRVVTKQNPITGEKTYTNICSPVSFNVDNVKQWTFHDNHRDYAKKISLELPPNTPTSYKE
jgi:hypothetical protein